MSSQNEIKRKLLHLLGLHKYCLQLLWKHANCVLAEHVCLKSLKMPYVHSHNNSAPNILYQTIVLPEFAWASRVFYVIIYRIFNLKSKTKKVSREDDDTVSAADCL